MLPLVIFAVALGVRLAHIWQLRPTPYFDVLLGDAAGYDAWARRLAAGDWLGADVFYQAPLYPYLLGVIYTVAGPDLLVARLCQAVIGSAACVCLGLAAARLFSRGAGFVAGLGLALYAPAVFFDALLQKASLDLFFVCLVLWLVARVMTGAPTRGAWLALGLAAGGLALTRENALVLIAVLLAFAVAPDVPGSASGSVRRLQPAAWILAGLALVLAPVVARNYAVGGGLYLTTSQFGPNFYIGNHAGADGTYASLRPGRGAPEFERTDATELAEFTLARPLSPAEVSRYWAGRAVRFITESPGEWAALMARKTALLLNTSEMLDTESLESHADVSWPLRVLGVAGHFGVLVPLATFGLWAAWGDRKRLWPLYALPAAYAASVVAFYVFARYRFPLVPFLVLFAAAGLTLAPAVVRRASRRELAVAGAALLALAVAVNRPMLPADRMRAITETNLGTALHEAGRSAEAEARFRAAIALQPGYAPAYNNLGVALRSQGRTAEAIRAYEGGLRRMSDYPDLHYNLANALLANGRPADAARHLTEALAAAPASAATHNNLGLAFSQLGRWDDALTAFRAAIAVEPDSGLAHRNLGNLLATRGRADEALAVLGRAVALNPGDAAARYDFGSVLLEQGRFREAVAEFEAALRIDPSAPETMNNLGIALASQGRLPEALEWFDRALMVRPGFADAQVNRARARAALAGRPR